MLTTEEVRSQWDITTSKRYEELVDSLTAREAMERLESIRQNAAVEVRDNADGPPDERDVLLKNFVAIEMIIELATWVGSVINTIKDKDEGGQRCT